MIEMDKSDRDCLRFLWWEHVSTQKFRIFRHRRFVFGVKSSPFLLAAVIWWHLKNVDAEDKSAADFLMKSFYVDNCVASLDTVDEYEEFKNFSTQLLAEVQIDLRQWERSGGLSWDRRSDTLL